MRAVINGARGKKLPLVRDILISKSINIKTVLRPLKRNAVGSIILFNEIRLGLTPSNYVYVPRGTYESV